ncbi:hypothetical protein [Paenibacillus polymyxa]|uniref:ART-PolyVal-like domain-containing protein n=1 Tax=Paenibacillus polymyxa (strain SC2) TaxID=886882 RepID=E3EJR0_PAEPS|nr:hypothetical protein [Paenibacillus polymyxa]ADO59658.1 hypothetical protein PPSC2_26835 [Paenibacillus polymyxa SC2]WPQ59516.1 hypothetical protein SKN87_28040 [Paenibacillus polymyxa]
MNKAFFKWFKQSKAIDVGGKPQIFFHGSIQEFSVFDTSRIRANETDALYNGFWFSSNKDDASPAWSDPKYVNAYYLSVQKPAPHTVIKELFKEIKADEQSYSKFSIEKGFRSWADVVRFELQVMGYDGVIHRDIPEINRKEFEEKGETVYNSNRCFQYKLKKHDDLGGVDLYRIQCGREDYITGYEDLKDFLHQHSERVFVVFKPSQIKSIHNEGSWCPDHNDVRY